MARDQVLVELYNALLSPFPAGLAGQVIDGVELVGLDEGIAGAASHYVNNTRPLIGVHRASLRAYVDDLDRIEKQLPEEYAREHFDRLRAIAKYLWQVARCYACNRGSPHVTFPHAFPRVRAVT